MIETEKVQLAHRSFNYKATPSYCNPNPNRMFDVCVFSDGSVKLYPDTNPATLTREEWAKLVLLVETVELPKPEPESDVVKTIESDESVAIAAD